MRVLLFTVLFYMSMKAEGQSTYSLQTGDLIPSGVIDKLVSMKGVETLENKLVVLEFWNIYCIACIKGMPKLDSLQKKYRGRLQVILVTDNTEEQAERFFRERGIILPDLPLVWRDKYFSTLFPHEGVPFAVVIENGKIRSQTFGYNINDKSIASLLSSPSIVLQDSRRSPSFDPMKPIWQNRSFQSDPDHVSSSISGRIPEAAGSYMFQAVDSFSFTLRFINWSLLDLFKVAFNQGYGGKFDYANRILLDSSAGKLKSPENEWELDAWNQKNTISYEIATSWKNRKRIFENMQMDLLQSFPYEVKIEWKKQPVLLLVKLKSTSVPQAKSLKKSLLVAKDSIVLHNVPVSNLVRAMNQQYQNLLPPIIDETGLTAGMDVVIEAGLENLFQLKAALQKIGFDLIRAERECEMLVIRKRI